MLCASLAALVRLKLHNNITSIFALAPKLEDALAAQEAVLKQLREALHKYPTSPGVYIMRDIAGEVIYVGKAINLRNRVKNYFGRGDGRSQIEFLMRRVNTIETLVVESEEQAFVLERDLIQRHKPRYNIMLRDDKNYLSVRIDQNKAWPRIETTRKVEQDGALYFGPYPYGAEIKSLLHVIKQVVPLRTCTDTVFYNRQRPCLEYQIKRCAGPCCLPVEQEQYNDWIKQAVNILSGKTDRTSDSLEKEMDKAASELRFEEAAAIRDRIEVLEHFARGRPPISHRGESRDVFGLYREATRAALCVLKVRFGRISDGGNFLLSDLSIDDAEVLEGAIQNYYQGGQEIPEEIVVPIDFENRKILERILAKMRNGSLEINIPQRGSKARLVQLAALNAREYYSSRHDAESRFVEVSREMSERFHLRQVPRRIECIDISNFQGSDTVGAVVSFFDGVPDKESYRRYRLEQQDKPDDFASISEVVTRRLRRGVQEEMLPDLIVIDGGAGQLSAALAARDSLGVEIDIIALAKERTRREQRSLKVTKKPERVFLSPTEAAIELSPDSGLSHLLARIRDEVHRFVITYHRNERSKRTFGSLLDKVSGVGPERKRRLLKEYKSVKAMRGIPAVELARTGRMPLSLAERVYSAVNSEDG